MKRVLSVFLLLSLLTLSGCSRELTDYTLQTQVTTSPTTESTTESLSIPETQPKEYRDYTTYPPQQARGNAVGNLYYITYSPVIRYYDMDLRREITLCSQPNCTHNDSKCVAYLGRQLGTSYIVRGDLVYAVVKNDDSLGGELLFIERNMITGETRIIWDMTPEEGMVRQYVEFSLYEEVAFLIFREYELQWDEMGGYYEKDPTHYSYEIDLATGQRELLLKGEALELRGFALNGDAIVPKACTENYLVIRDMEYNEEAFLTMEEYTERYPQGDYGLYIWDEYEQMAHYSLDRRTGERKRICGNLKEAAMRDGNCMGEGKMFFAQGDTVYMYDGYIGEITPCFEQENVILLRYYDGRLHCNVDVEGEDIVLFYWYDLQTGEKMQFQEGISPLIFSIHGETVDYFYGSGPGETRAISKQDFYNENYDAAF